MECGASGSGQRLGDLLTMSLDKLHAMMSSDDSGEAQLACQALLYRAKVRPEERAAIVQFFRDATLEPSLRSFSLGEYNAYVCALVLTPQINELARDLGEAFATDIVDATAYAARHNQLEEGRELALEALEEIDPARAAEVRSEIQVNAGIASLEPEDGTVESTETASAAGSESSHEVPRMNLETEGAGESGFAGVSEASSGFSNPLIVVEFPDREIVIDSHTAREIVATLTGNIPSSRSAAMVQSAEDPSRSAPGEGTRAPGIFTDTVAGAPAARSSRPAKSDQTVRSEVPHDGKLTAALRPTVTADIVASVADQPQPVREKVIAALEGFIRTAPLGRSTEGAKPSARVVSGNGFRPGESAGRTVAFLTVTNGGDVAVRSEVHERSSAGVLSGLLLRMAGRRAFSERPGKSGTVHLHAGSPLVTGRRERKKGEGQRDLGGRRVSGGAVAEGEAAGGLPATAPVLSGVIGNREGDPVRAFVAKAGQRFARVDEQKHSSGGFRDDNPDGLEWTVEEEDDEDEEQVG